MTEVPSGSHAEESQIAPIVIVGCQRSGTTLLRTMLGNHPDLLVHPYEPQFFLELLQRFGTYINNIPKAVTLVSNHPYRAPEVTPEQMNNAFEGLESCSLKEFAWRYLSTWGGNDLATKRPVLKDPTLIFHLDLVFTLFPRATIVHLVRDPRANVSSQRSRWPQFTVWESAMLWRNAVRSGRSWAQLERSEYVEIQFEKLVQEPEQALKKLCQELQIPYTERMLEFEQIETTYAPGEGPQKTRFTSADPSRLLLWQERLTPTEIRLVEKCCQQEMGWWNYRPLHPPVPQTAFTVRLALEWLNYYVMRMGRGLKSVWRTFGWRLR